MKFIIIIPVTQNYCYVCYSHFWWIWTQQSCLLWTNMHIWTRTCLSQIMWNTSRISKRVYYQIDHTLSCTIQLYQNNEISLLI